MARVADVQEPSKGASQWAPSPRVPLWTELERLYAILNLAPPTETLTIEQLEQRVTEMQIQAGEEPRAVYMPTKTLDRNV